MALPMAVAPALVPAMRKSPLLCRSLISSPNDVPEMRVVNRDWSPPVKKSAVDSRRASSSCSL